MKTTAIRTMIFTVITLLVGTYTVQAQDFFFDKKYKDEKVVSKVKYEKSYTGLYEKTYLYEYTYTLFDELEMEDVYKWDNAKNTWVADHRIVRQEDMLRNTVSLDYILWNAEKKEYNAPALSLVYQRNVQGTEFMYLVTKKKNEVNEIINQFPHHLENISDR